MVALLLGLVAALAPAWPADRGGLTLFSVLKGGKEKGGGVVALVGPRKEQRAGTMPKEVDDGTLLTRQSSGVISLRDERESSRRKDRPRKVIDARNEAVRRHNGEKTEEAQLKKKINDRDKPIPPSRGTLRDDDKKPAKGMKNLLGKIVISEYYSDIERACQ